MELFTYLMAKNDHNTSVKKDLFSYLLGKNQSGTYTDYSGTSLSINNTKKGKMKVNLLGNTSQYTTTGKNLLKQTAYVASRTSNNLTYTNNGDGTFSITGTANADTSITLLWGTDNINLESGKTYTLYSSVPYNSNTFNLSIPYKQDGVQKYLIAGSTVTTSGEITNVMLSFYTNSGNTINAQNVKLMLVEGSTAGDYEPYTGGIPSPNPSFSQDIHIVSGDNTINVTGKNLFDLDNAYNISINANGGTGTNNDYRTTDYLPTQPNTNYYFSTTQKSGQTSKQIYIAYYDSNKTFISRPSYNLLESAFTTPTNTHFIRAGVYIAGQENIMLKLGNTATTYEPYQSTSYPIHLGGELFDYSYQVEKQYNSSGTQQSSQRYTLSNNVITISRNKSNYGRYFMNKKQLIAGDYTLKFTPTLSGSDNRISFSIMDLDTQVEYDEETITITNGTEITKTFTLDTSANISFNIQPYKDTSGTLTFTNVSLKSSIELCKIGTYQDKFFKNIPNTTDYKSNLEDNEWYLEKKIGKVVLNGSESWNSASSVVSGTSRFYYDNNDILNPGSTNTPLSNMFKSLTWSEMYSQDTTTRYGVAVWDDASHQGRLIIRIDNTLANSVANFKTWLGTNQPTVYYVLATPTYTPITGTLKDELEAVWRANSYKGQTNISQVNNDLPFNMNVEIKVGN